MVGNHHFHPFLTWLFRVRLELNKSRKVDFIGNFASFFPAKSTENGDDVESGGDVSNADIFSLSRSAKTTAPDKDGIRSVM